MPDNEDEYLSEYPVGVYTDDCKIAEGSFAGPINAHEAGKNAII